MCHKGDRRRRNTIKFDAGPLGPFFWGCRDATIWRTQIGVPIGNRGYSYPACRGENSPEGVAIAPSEYAKDGDAERLLPVAVVPTDPTRKPQIGETRGVV